MLDLPDPISDLIGVFFKHAAASQLAKRLTLILELAIAGTIAYLVGCGGALVAKQPEAWSRGVGMVMAGLALFATFQASPNSKGLTISVQSQVAAEKLNTPVTTIERK